MKKWKILHDLDKQSTQSIKKVPSKPDQSDNEEQKQQSKPYRPLRRSRHGGSSGERDSLKKSTSSQLYMPSFGQRYIRCSETQSNHSGSKKIKTENFDDVGLGFQSLEGIQSNYIDFHASHRNTDRKTNSRQNLKQNHQKPGQTERVFQKSQVSLNRRPSSTANLGKQKKCSKVSQMDMTVRKLKQQQKNLKTNVRSEFSKYKLELQKSKNGWIKFLKNYQPNIQTPQTEEDDCLERILQNYQSYKQRMEELEEQKQVFLQSLIKMASQPQDLCEQV